jgi:hypothetical protein
MRLLLRDAEVGHFQNYFQPNWVYSREENSITKPSVQCGGPFLPGGPRVTWQLLSLMINLIILLTLRFSIYNQSLGFVTLKPRRSNQRGFLVDSSRLAEREGIS